VIVCAVIDGSIGDNAVASAPVTVGRSPVCSRSSSTETTGDAVSSGTPARSTTGAGSAAPVFSTSRWRAASCGCTTVGAHEIRHAGPSPVARRRPASPW
jgi:hypothetical protein